MCNMNEWWRVLMKSLLDKIKMDKYYVLKMLALTAAPQKNSCFAAFFQNRYSVCVKILKVSRLSQKLKYTIYGYIFTNH